MFPIKDTNFGPNDKKPYLNTVLFSLKQNMNCGGTGCFICLYILNTAFSIKVHLFSVLGSLLLTVPRIVISWEASLVSNLLKTKRSSKKVQVWLFPALLLVELLFLYRVHTKCYHSDLLHFVRTLSLSSGLFKIKAMRNQTHGCYG